MKILELIQNYPTETNPSYAIPANNLGKTQKKTSKRMRKRKRPHLAPGSWVVGDCLRGENRSGNSLAVRVEGQETA
ncbi:hypothetical protein RRG08_053943 [Elysia crispata]|uniref:Uncharacterized protein n=1 Tax=Elysia crispata TaxID=231223 RepID=A0AAE0ZE81_9GAST|nr:hypothetical protein RRG08_053943 [Elysia crispata]